MKSTLVFMALLLLGMFCLSPVYGQTHLYVNGSIASSGAGTSWATAKKTVTEALMAANAGTGAYEIWVRTGVYRPTTASGTATTSRDSSFRILRDSIKLYGGFAGYETSLSQRTNISFFKTTLSGDIGTLNDSTDNSYHVMTITALGGSTIDSNTVVDGFTIEKGNANSVSILYVYGLVQIGSNRGGGLAIKADTFGMSVSPKVENCTFQKNTAYYGGGIYGESMRSSTLSPGIKQCIFEDNQSRYFGGAVNFSLKSGSNSIYFSDCIFKKNRATYGGAIDLYFYNTLHNDGVYFNACVFDSNAAYESGGALFSAIGGFSVQGITGISNCVFAKNRQTGYTTGFGGAAVIEQGINCQVSNSTFYENTIASATVPNANAIYNLGNLSIRNSIVWGADTNQILNTGTGILSYAYSDLRGTIPIGMNLNTDPLFVIPSDPDGADNVWGTSDDGLHLRYCAPTENTGSNWGIPINAKDITGAPRVQNTFVDMGAYENGTSPSRVYVDSSVASSGTGYSWASPFKTLTEALTYVNAIDCINEIWVKKGTYYPSIATGAATTNRDSSFRILRDSIKLYGGFAGTETALSQRNPTLNVTTLSGDIGTVGDSTDNSYHVLTIISNSGSTIDTTTVVDGFTISWAYSGSGIFTLGSITSLIRSDGGGILNVANSAGTVASPLIENCIFTRNRSDVGGGMYNRGNGGVSSPIVKDCYFFQNYATTVGALHAYSANGGTSSPIVTRC